MFGQEMTEITPLLESNNSKTGQEFGKKFTDFFINYPQIIVLISIPFAAIGQYFAHIRTKDSFAKHFYYVIYIQSFIGIVAFIPAIFLNHYMYYILISLVFTFITIIWLYVVIYKGDQNRFVSALRCLVGMFYSVIVFAIIGLLVIVIGGLLFKVKGL
jgi:hypothetical protein